MTATHRDYQYAAVPEELRARAQWVCWRWEWNERKGDWDKVPIEPRFGHKASTTDRATWGTFDEAVTFAGRRDLAGIGFVFSEDDPFCGVDLDDCRDPRTGDIEDWAKEVIGELDSYGEVSPSESGAKLIVRAVLPGSGGPKPLRAFPRKVEVYDRRRFFAVTGKLLEGAPAEVKDR